MYRRRTSFDREGEDSATAVDLDPGNSQLQIQLGAALTQLRREVLEAGRDR